MRTQGRYTQARQIYEQSLHIVRQQEDVAGQGLALGRLGALAMEEGRYDEARKCYMEAQDLYRVLGEPRTEAVAWHNLARVAEAERKWAEAERCSRESLALKEQYGDETGAANTCNQLANIALFSGRPAEAEGWYRRALTLYAQARTDSLAYATTLSNLANLLADEVRAGRAPRERLAEARDCAERSLAIKEPQEASAEIWKTLGILADIADLEGQTEAARAYRRRERETFPVFPGNRFRINHQHGRLIASVAAAARGTEQMRAAVEMVLPRLEAGDWHISAAIERIWAGERDWHALAEGLDTQDALLILRILETLTQPPLASEESIAPQFGQLIAGIAAAATGDARAQAAVEEILTQLEADDWHIAAPIRRIWAGERDLPALVAGLDTQDTLIVGRILDLLSRPSLEVGEGDDTWAFVAAVALAAGGHQEARAAVEETLPHLEAAGLHITNATQRIWVGERDAAALSAGLDALGIEFIQRVLGLLTM